MRAHLRSYRAVFRDESPVSRAAAARAFAVLAGLVIPALLAGLVWALHEARANAHREAEIKAVACRNYNALRREIANTPAARKEVLQALGFDDAQIAAINRQQAESRIAQLALLGAAPDGCQP